jgi:hypothetical protein
MASPRASVVASRASPRLVRVLVSRTVVDLVAGSGLHFSDRGAYRVAEGVDKWHVFDAADDERDTGEELAAAEDYYVVQP